MISGQNTMFVCQKCSFKNLCISNKFSNFANYFMNQVL
jgi:hypothetical protein